MFTPSMLFYWKSRDFYSEHAVLLEELGCVLRARCSTGRVRIFTPSMLFYWKSRDVYSGHAVLLEE